ncbi:MAG TPA: hypothetical protein DD381_14385 [Lentisphaeria bacterium]|nr:MAG: hypothetical protein A2X47_00885 [Lentisphaerae bacterium GWF2_38_69]HBM17513.1 hypothetical protein [Lentisphaeria bacterium]
MPEDISKSAKIKLSLNDLAPKLPSASTDSASNNFSPEKTANLSIKPILTKPPVVLPSEAPKINVDAPSAGLEEKTRITLKKPQLQDIKLKVNQEKINEEAPPVDGTKMPAPVPAYARGNVPDQAESDATSPSLKIEEDYKGKTQKFIEPEPTPKKPVIDLNALKIDLNKETKTAEPEEKAAAAPPLPNIDYGAKEPKINKVISDTIKLKIKPRGEVVSAPISDPEKDANKIKIPSPITKEIETKPPSSLDMGAQMPKVQDFPTDKGAALFKSDDNFTIPTNVDSAYGKPKTKKKQNMIFLGILTVVLIVLIYFMITSIKTLAS